MRTTSSTASFVQRDLVVVVVGLVLWLTRPEP